MRKEPSTEFGLPRHVVIEGPIGVGKTTLAEALADRLEARLLLEKFEENPFLSLFYREPERYALQTELSFLVSRYRQQEQYLQGELFQRYTISDYLFSKCALFASLTLESHELQLFEDVYRVLNQKLPEPDLVVFLYAPVEVLLTRISERGRSYEQHIQPDYLEQLCHLYRQEFSRSRKYPVMTLDTTSIDFREPENIDRILHLMVSSQSGRIETERFMRAPTTSLLFGESSP